MESKYYSPTIDEFYVGFEYYFCSTYQEGVDIDEIIIDGEDGYKKYIYDIPSNSKWDSKGWIISGLEHNQFKVKYLDKSDIEELGFEYKEDRGMSENYGHLFYLPYNESTGLVCCLRYWFNSNRVEIKRNHIGTIFDGTIKNKSELKKLLTQLNIN